MSNAVAYRSHVKLRCCLLVWAGALLILAPTRAANFSDASRWTSTATNPTGLARGDALTLTWGVVPDGTSIPDPFAGGAVRTSNFIAFLDARYGGAPAGTVAADLTLRPWFPILRNSLAVIASKTGLSYAYQPDDGAGWGTAGSLGARGDVRIGGFDIAPGYLGFNAFPASGGDMVLDTAAGNPFGNATDLRNVFLHEHGHGLGLGHVSVAGANVMMTANFNGPQYDDIYALQRMYGDAYEKGSGNDSITTAVPLGDVLAAPLAVGVQGNDQAILADETNIVSIDGASDADFYKFTVSAATDVDLRLHPSGPTYTFTAEGGSQQTHFGAGQSNLRFDLYAADGTVPLYKINAAGLGADEKLTSVRLPAAGDYYVRIAGQEDRAQLYEFRISGVAASTPANPRLVFHDAFDVSDGAAADVNAAYNLLGRQAAGRINSLYRVTTTDTSVGDGDTATAIAENRLRMTSTGDANGSNQGVVDLMRNLAPELAGRHWNASFDITLTGDAGLGDSWFGFTFNDTDPPSGPFAESAEMSMLIRPGGSMQIKENAGNQPGDADYAGAVTGAVHRFELDVDESGQQSLMSVTVDGQARIVNEPITLIPTGRFFSLRLHVGAGDSVGLTLQAEIDDFEIAIVATRQSADFNIDGAVDEDDLVLWQSNYAGVLPPRSGDADGNGRVDGSDFLLWQQQIGAGRPAIAEIPEPTACTMCLLAATGLFRRRRKAPEPPAAPNASQAPNRRINA